MTTLIDWHAHHTAPEIAERINELTGKRPHIDAYDSPDLAKRLKRDVFKSSAKIRISPSVSEDPTPSPLPTPSCSKPKRLPLARGPSPGPPEVQHGNVDCSSVVRRFA